MSSLFQDKARPPDEAALAAALGPALDAAGLPEALAAEIRAGRRLPEGRAARVELRGEAEFPQVLDLLALKAGGEGR